MVASSERNRESCSREGDEKCLKITGKQVEIGLLLVDQHYALIKYIARHICDASFAFILEFILTMVSDDEYIH